MIEFIVKYWVQVLLGLIVGALSFACKKFYSLYQLERQHQKTKEHEEFAQELKSTINTFAEESKRGDLALQGQIDILREGILSIQKAHFKKCCRELLAEDHRITAAEFESITSDHSAYNALGGNHDGDILFDMVKEKAKNNLKN